MTTSGRAAPGRWLPLLVLLVVATVVVVAVMVQDGPRRADLDRGAGPASASQDRQAAAAELVERLEDALAAGSSRDAEALAAQDDRRARRELRVLARNVRVLGVERLGLRYVADLPDALSRAEERRLGEDTWTSEVQVSWRLAGVDTLTSTVEVPLATSWSDGRAAFESTRLDGGDDPTPLWLRTGLERRDAAQVTVLAPRGTQAAELTRQGSRAVDTVRRVLPRWRGPLVVEVAPTRRDFRATSGLSPQAALRIAAVTATTDGVPSRTSPVRVFVNAAVFTPLGRRGQQIVLSHEAAHVALRAVQTKAPLWLAEGVADYVALVDSPLPPSVLAAQILRRVREEGAPTHLPGPAEFDASRDAIGAWYEASWLAARLLAERYGEDALLEFYRVADAGGGLDAAFRDVLGTTERAFVREWRDHLSELAG